MAAYTVLVAAFAAALCAGSTGADAAAGEPSAPLQLLDGRVDATSPDGRFVLTEARAEATQALATPDGRYRLVDTRRPDVGCDPLGDQLFANGFE